MKKGILLYAVLFFCVLPALRAQNESTGNIEDTMVGCIAQELRSYPQEKIYVQTDKPYYSAGDTIWFKAYLVHAALHQPIHFSRYVYVELVNETGEVVMRERVRPENGMYYCQLPLKADFQAGHYSLRSYTNYMRNLPEEYFFRKDVFIGNTIKSGSDAQEAWLTPQTSAGFTDSQPVLAAGQSFDVRFFPEGGNLIAGTMQNVAFKAIARDGLSCAIHGRILDEEGRELTRFQSTHLGMGSFGLSVPAGKSYTAVCENELGEELRVSLPAATDSTYSLNINRRNGTMRIGVLTPNGEILKEQLHLLVLLRGAPLFKSTLSGENSYVSLPIDDLPAGVVQILLANDRREILAERLVFIRESHPVRVDVHFDRSTYERRQRVNGEIRLLDSEGRPLSGNYSLSVTDDNCIRNDSSAMTIESYLLLTSDLKGHIENPGDYFKKSNDKADGQLDLLMMTQGWRRYDIPRIVRGETQHFDTYELEAGSTLCGRLQTYPIRRGMPNTNISVFNSTNNYVNAVVTDNSGRFCIDGFEFADSSDFFIQADKKPGTMLELSIEPQSFPPVGIRPILPREDIHDKQMELFLNKSRERFYYENGSMVINLEAAVVTGQKSKADELRQDRGAYYNYASYTFEAEEIQDLGAITLLDVLIQAPGITLNANGTGVLLRNAVPLIVVDNFPGMMEDLTTIPIADVEMIDILKEPSQTQLYPNGKNGVICIYLKRGGRNEPVELGSHQKRIKYLGYTSPVEFYQPMYSVEKQKNNPDPDLRNTLYWKPDIVPDSEGKTDIRFYTADERSSYTLILEGVSDQGDIVRAVRQIRRQ